VLRKVVFTMTETVEQFLERKRQADPAYQIPQIERGQGSGKTPDWHTQGGDWLQIKERISSEYWPKKK